jgi:hypothetical protein
LDAGPPPVNARTPGRRHRQEFRQVRNEIKQRCTAAMRSSPGRERR